MQEERPKAEVIVECPVVCSTDMQAVPSWTLTIEDTSDGSRNVAHADADTVRRSKLKKRRAVRGWYSEFVLTDVNRWRD